ncbi:methyltransferase domain-containing protein [Xylaria nigripes]|nr:methyltransferase domain-containing protein [Xylaria nigripes]
MSDILTLPSTTYQPPFSSPVRRMETSLNTIMEEEPEDFQHAQAQQDQRGLQVRQSSDKIVQWLTPRSLHFPTPRGFHFMSAPILPDSPSTASFDENNSPSTSSNPWHRTSLSTDVTDFDDIYDVSDDEESQQKMAQASSLRRRHSSDASVSEHLKSESPASPRMLLPHLVMPDEQEFNVENWSETTDPKKLVSIVPPTPPAKVEVSPTTMSLLELQQSQDVPTISAPPSLDGSLSSDQMAAISAPITPIMTSNDDVLSVDWSGVQLQPGALETLQALSGNEEMDEEYQPEQVIEVPGGRTPEMAQQTRPFLTATPQRYLGLDARQHQNTMNGLTRLEIPSPGDFFSNLSLGARRSWYLPPVEPEEVAPPTSTTAEQFYRCPWRELTSQEPEVSCLTPAVEHVVEISSTMSDGMPTATPITQEQIMEAMDSPLEGAVTAWLIEQGSSPTSLTAVTEPTSPSDDMVVTETATIYDPEYARKQEAIALSNVDRTGLWLAAQKAYLNGLYVEEAQSELRSEQETTAKETEFIESPASPIKKAVRFSEAVVQTNMPRSLTPEPDCDESAYYRAFHGSVTRACQQDAFVHRLPRFEAIQTQRMVLRKAHRNQLLGNYKLSIVPQSERKRMSANVVRGDDVLVDDPERLNREKEVEASAQIATANWYVNAIKALNGGQLFSAPVARRVAELSGIGKTGAHTRILDLGGLATCDWAWHCAITYPNTKVYSVTTKAIQQLSNCDMRGPSNHRQVAVARLTRLPFPDGHFDVVSARELHSILKSTAENGEDEWVTCLSEVMRVLKPDGYLDFSIIDSDLVNAGPLGLAKSVVFGFTLKTLGYDPYPTRQFLGRLKGAGFEEVRRAWMCLPMGHLRRPAGEKPLPVLRDSQGVERFLELEGILQGSTEDAACIAGVAGGWTWERWLLRCEMEKVASEGRLGYDAAEMPDVGNSLNDVYSIIEEGRSCGAAYRMLSGFARKPSQQRR